MKKSAVILSYHFYPSAEVGARRPSELALSLQRSGWNIVVVTAKPSRFARVDTSLSDAISDLTVFKVTNPPSLESKLVHLVKKLLGRDSNSNGKWELSQTPPGAMEKAPLRKRIWSESKRYYFSVRYLFGTNKAWSILAFFRLVRVCMSDQYSVIISSGPPMPAHIAAVVVKKLFRKKWVMDMRDPWFLADFAPAQYRSAFRTMLDTWVEQRCYRNADLIVCTSPGAARIINERCAETKSRTRVVLNGYDIVVNSITPSPTGKLRLLYTGAIYFNRNPFPLFEAIDALLDESNIDRENIQFDLFGQCEEWQGIQIIPWLEERGLSDVIRVHAAVDHSEVSRQIAHANVLVNFAQGQPDQIPAKTYEQIVSGREVLVISELDSDTASVTTASGAGSVVPPEEPERILQALLRLYNCYVVEQREYRQPPMEVLSAYSRASQNQAYAEYLTELVNSN